LAYFCQFSPPESAWDTWGEVILKVSQDIPQGWLTDLLKRRHPNIAALALANKNVRTVWALLAHGREFETDYVATRVVA
jgi:hypothetical protein